MNEYYWTAQPHVTNESHINKSFQRTVSAQVSLTFLSESAEKLNSVY